MLDARSHEQIEPVYVDDEIAAIGLNSARSLTIKDGRINAQQVARAHAFLSNLPQPVVKIVVCHHPFDVHPTLANRRVVGGARSAMTLLASCGTDVILSGHYHLSYTSHAAERYRAAGRAVLFVQAGTSLSTRRRSEPNSFNVLRLTPSRIEVARYGWNQEMGAFQTAVAEIYQSGAEGWARLNAERGDVP